MTEVEDLGDQPRDLSDSSYYLTRLLNSLMADLSLKKHRKKPKNFKMTALMTPEEHSELCDMITIIFERSANHKTLQQNLKEFTEINKFDFYYRFLVYLQESNQVMAFNRMCLALVALLSKSNYLLPDIYRAISIYLLAKVVKPSVSQVDSIRGEADQVQSPVIFSALSLCRLNKFFFYTTEQKRMFADLLEQVFISKLAHFNTDIEERLFTVDNRLHGLAVGIDGLLFGEEKKKPPKAVKIAGTKEHRSGNEDGEAKKRIGKDRKKTKIDEDAKKSDDEKKETKKDKKSKDADPDAKKTKKTSPDKSESPEKDKKKSKTPAKKSKEDDEVKDDGGKKKKKEKKEDEKAKKDEKEKKKKDDEKKGKSKDKPEKDKKAKEKGDKKEKAGASKKKKKDGKEGAEVGAYPADSEEDEIEGDNEDGENEEEVQGSIQASNSNSRMGKIG